LVVASTHKQEENRSLHETEKEARPVSHLLALSSNLETKVAFSFRDWRHRGEDGPHGYGFAYAHRGAPVLIRSASSLAEKADEVGLDLSRVRSTLFICHLRFPDAGPLDGSNTRPFLAEHHGLPLAFAHSGALPAVRLHRPLAVEGSRPTSDSEHAFRWMLERLPPAEDEGFLPALKEAAADLHPLGTFTFMLTDGRNLWAHAGTGLHWAVRTSPRAEAVVRLPDDGYEMRFAGMERPGERALVVSSRPFLAEEEWNALAPGQFLAVRDGRVM
jgi:predicted glutamine amidotransferase